MDSSVIGRGKVAGLTGWSGDEDYFQFREVAGFQPAAVLDVLRGSVLGVVFRGAIPLDRCAEVAKTFYASEFIKRRDGEAPVQYVGAYHYHKSTAVYLDECVREAPAVEQILADADEDPTELFFGGLKDFLRPQGITMRPAGHEGRNATTSIIRSWLGQGEFALEPHEDAGQCREPGQADFEIQQVLRYQVCAMNMCLENGPAGKLKVWNIQPDHESKQRHGTWFSGSPYELDSLEGVESLRLAVEPGDIYVFNGAHVHAVEPSGEGERRSTLSGLLGFIDDATVVAWT